MRRPRRPARAPDPVDIFDRNWKIRNLGPDYIEVEDENYDLNDPEAVWREAGWISERDLEILQELVARINARGDIISPVRWGLIRKDEIDRVVRECEAYAATHACGQQPPFQRIYQLFAEAQRKDVFLYCLTD